MKYSDDERAIIWLDSLIGLSKEQKLRIINETKSPSAIMKDPSLVINCVGKSIKESTYQNLIASLKLGAKDDILSELDELGAVAVTCMSDYYPDSFLRIPDPPLVIYCKGNLDLLKSKHLFTIVGSRKTLPQIIVKATEFSEELSKNGVTLVTGLAEGVDSAVIKGALPSGNIISIIPSGFKNIYPEFNHRLFDETAEKGLVVTEHTPDYVARAFSFPERNRLLAALGHGVLVCSAGKKSGTNYTADFANEYGKTVFAFPYTLGVPSGEGCNAMIKEFAMLCDDVEDIFTSLGVVAKKKEEKNDLSPKEQKVYECIKEGEIHIDLLLEKTGMKIFEISPLLSMLEIKKYIVKNPGNTYSATK